MKLKLSISHLASNSFRTDNCTLTSISFNDIPLSNYPAICLLHHSVNFFFVDALNERLTVRFRGWSRFTIFAGTRTERLQFSRNFSFTCSVICPLKTFKISNAYLSFETPTFSHSVFK